MRSRALSLLGDQILAQRKTVGGARSHL